MPFYTALKIKDGDTAKQEAAGCINSAETRSIVSERLAKSGPESDPGKAVRIATWNFREFGGSKYGGRDFEHVYTAADESVYRAEPNNGLTAYQNKRPRGIDQCRTVARGID